MKRYVPTLLGLAMTVAVTMAHAAILPVPEGPDLLANRPAGDFSMSSNYDSSRAWDVLNRKPNGGYAFHTKDDGDSWWEARFAEEKEPKKVKAVVVWNRMNFRSRANSLIIELSKNGKSWTRIYNHSVDRYKAARLAVDNDGTFGGFHEKGPQDPLVVLLRPDQAKQGFCFVRLRLDDRNCLHMDSVQVIGADEGKDADKGKGKDKGKSKGKDDDSDD